jgi:dicarboxylate transporter 10
MQADRGKIPSERYGYRNAIHGLYRIARDEGPRNLLRGVDVTVFRAILTNTGQLAS